MKKLPRFDPRNIKVSKGQSDDQFQKTLDDFILESDDVYPGEPAVRDFKGRTYRSLDDMIAGKTWDQSLAETRQKMPLAADSEHYPSYGMKNPYQDQYLMEWVSALRKKLGM